MLQSNFIEGWRPDINWKAVLAASSLYFLSNCRTKSGDFRMRWMLESAVIHMAEVMGGLSPLIASTISTAPGPTSKVADQLFGADLLRKWADNRNNGTAVASEYHTYITSLFARQQKCVDELKKIDRDPGKTDSLAFNLTWESSPRFRQEVSRCIDRHFPRIVGLLEFLAELSVFTHQASWRRHDLSQINTANDAIDFFSDVAQYLDIPDAPSPPDEINVRSAMRYASALKTICEQIKMPDAKATTVVPDKRYVQAGASFQEAVRANPSIMDIRGKNKQREAAYKWIETNGSSAYTDDDTFPTFDTWQRYVRESEKLP